MLRHDIPVRQIWTRSPTIMVLIFTLSTTKSTGMKAGLIALRYGKLKSRSKSLLLSCIKCVWTSLSEQLRTSRFFSNWPFPHCTGMLLLRAGAIAILRCMGEWILSGVATMRRSSCWNTTLIHQRRCTSRRISSGYGWKMLAAVGRSAGH